MKKIPHLITILTIFFLSSCIIQKDEKVDKNKQELSAQVVGDTVYSSESLNVIQLSPNIYQHISYLYIEGYGNFPCNGMIYSYGKESVVFDTPIDNKSTIELLEFILNKLESNIKAVIPTHFHVDCIGGLEEVQKQGINVLANKKTIDLIDNGNIDESFINSFENEISIKIGGETVIAKYFGEGHTSDNIIGYIPSEKIIFGGCLIKSIGAGKGNLEDANTTEWPNTVNKLKQTYQNAQIVIPGHGEYGTSTLFDYTIEMFGS
ncbi:MAG: subclass B1 metallo-beta-lactamase [Chlorobiota bacterium]